MNVNVNGVYYCNRHVIKTMREKDMVELST